MSDELRDTIFKLRDEIRQLTADTLAKSGDKRARWQRAQEIKDLKPDLEEQVARLPTFERPELDKALAGSDAIVLAVRHKPYLDLDPDEVVNMAGGPLAVVDCFGILDDKKI